MTLRLTLILLLSAAAISQMAAQCYDSAEIILQPGFADSNCDGAPDDGETIEFCYTVTGWNDGCVDEDWFHGVQVDLPASGYVNASVTSTAVPPSENAEVYTTGGDYRGWGTFSWYFEDPDMASTGNAGTTNQDFGWYVDREIENAGSDFYCGNSPIGPFDTPPDGNGHNNFGLPSTSCNNWLSTATTSCLDLGVYIAAGNPIYVVPFNLTDPPLQWTFCFEITLDCGGDCATNPPGDITIYTQGDGTTGSWENSTCTDPGTVYTWDGIINNFCSTTSNPTTPSTYVGGANCATANCSVNVMPADTPPNFPADFAFDPSSPQIECPANGTVCGAIVSNTVEYCFEYTHSTTDVVMDLFLGASSLETQDGGDGNECDLLLWDISIYQGCGNEVSTTSQFNAFTGNTYTICYTASAAESDVRGPDGILCNGDEPAPSATEGTCFLTGGYAALMPNTTIPLPVELLSFKAEPVDNRYIQVSWETASEENASHFEVERSTDGVSFNYIGEVPTTGSGSAYSFNDERAEPGIQYFYRIRMVDFDLSYEYSDVDDAMIADKRLMLLSAYPNPVTEGQLNIGLYSSTAKDVEVKAYNVVGQAVSSLVFELAAGENLLQLPAHEWAAGSYFVHITDGQESIVEQVIVK